MKVLHEIDELRVYCGPAALMAITGKRLTEVRGIINQARGRSQNSGVCGLAHKHLEQAMTLMGIKYSKVTPDKIKLAKLMLQKDTRYIITVTGHYIAYLNGTVVDNHTRFGTTMDECKWRNKTVKHYYQLAE
jgi:hypothetical protein